MWKFMMAKCQQMDLYMKPRIGFSSEDLPKFPHNYNPNGRSKFEDDALVLRAFWDSLTDYPNLWFNGQATAGSAQASTIESGPGRDPALREPSHKYVLSSRKEAVAYCSSATAKDGVKFESRVLKLKDLPLSDGGYRMDIVKPDKGILKTRRVAVVSGAVSIRLPAFTDDIAVHIYRGSR